MEIDKRIIDFIKGLMQPMITIVMAITFLGYAGAGKFEPIQVFGVIVSVLGFWFGFKLLKDFTYNGKDESPKADTPTITPSGGKVAGIGCAPPVTDDWGYELGDAESPPEADGAVDQAIDSIYADLKADGVKSTTAAVAARVVSWLGAHSGELTKAEEKEIIEWGIQNAQYSYVATTGLQKAPSTYAEVADYNKWWRENQAACKAPKGEARAVLMTLRDLLKRAGK